MDGEDKTKVSLKSKKKNISSFLLRKQKLKICKASKSLSLMEIPTSKVSLRRVRQDFDNYFDRVGNRYSTEIQGI